MFSQFDKQMMRRAIQLAQIPGVKVAPNPMVGAVITLNEKIIGEGYHKQYGASHAEVNAIESVVDKSLLNQSTIYVNLEPCSHFGKTPPCSDLIVKSGFKRVVIGCSDSNKVVSGKGIAQVKNAGIQVDVGCCEEDARFINRRFFTFHELKRPYIILKWAQTKDGYIDKLPENRGEGVQWITAPETKIITHKWRSDEQAIVVGWKTILNDNPKLTVRKIAGDSPIRIIIDPHCQAPTDAAVFTDGYQTICLVKKNDYFDMNKLVEVMELGQDFTLDKILQSLFQRNYISIFVEGGATTLDQFITAEKWDEARVYEGKTEFINGVPAPNMPKEVFKKETYGTDLINYYYK